MVNNSNIDSWKAQLNSNISCRINCPNLQGNKAFINHQIESDKIAEDTIYNMPAKNHQSESEIRYINPTNYTKSVNEEKDNMMQIQSKNNYQEAGSFNKQVTKADHYDPDSSMLNLSLKYSTAKDATIIENMNNQMQTGQSTYRCYSTSFPDTTSLPQSSSVHSIISSGTVARVERRCRIVDVIENIGTDEVEKQEKYTADNRQIIRISTTSLSAGSSHTNCEKSDRSDHNRRLAHSEWLRKKDEAAQRKREQEVQAAQKQQEEDERIARQKEEKALLEKENFIKWIERKKQQELERKVILENKLELQKHLKEIEERAAVAKALYLHQWAHKKKEEQKVRHKEQKLKQELKQQKINEEREKRLQQSTKAYEKWKKNSKNKSKPATQGLLPHQKAKPAYINPIPWQSIVIVDSDETKEDMFNDTNRLKGNGKETIVTDQ